MYAYKFDGKRYGVGGKLGYLKAKIKADVILTNVISTAGQKDNNIVTVKIEGDLP